MLNHEHKTKLLDGGNVSLGRSHIQPGSLTVNGKELPSWLAVDYDAGTVRRTDGVVGDRRLYTFAFSWDDVNRRTQEALLQKAAAARASAASIPGWATWDSDQVRAWLDANIDDPNTRTALDAMAQMLLALRDNAWPALGIGKD